MSVTEFVPLPEDAERYQQCLDNPEEAIQNELAKEHGEFTDLIRRSSNPADLDTCNISRHTEYELGTLHKERRFLEATLEYARARRQIQLPEMLIAS